MAIEDESSFIAKAKEPLPANEAHDGVDAMREVREDVSDGLVLRQSSSFASWLRRSYLRKDCRCGHCPASDPEPCPYARPEQEQEGVLQSVLSGATRSLQRMLSVNKQD